MVEQQASLADLPRVALDTYRDEYKDLSETWRSLDTKAQGIGAISGIFLAAVFAWGRDLPAGFGQVERLLLIGCIVLLVASIAAAVLAMQVRKVAAPPLGKETADMVKDILYKQKPEEMLDRAAAFYNDQINVWHDTNKDMQENCDSKAVRIQFGQATLLLAGVLVAVLAIVPIACAL